MRNVRMWRFFNTVLSNKKPVFSSGVPVLRGLENDSEQNGLLALGLRLVAWKHKSFNERKQMHASQLAELGSWIAAHSGGFVYGHKAQTLDASNEYWTASKCRLQRWITALKMFEKDIANPSNDHDPWPALEVIVQEILLSEFLTRIWAATVHFHDEYQGTDELQGLANSTFVSHIEARNRAVRLLLAGQGSNEAVFDRFNALRRKMERWTDLFLSQIPNLEVARKFAFDANRVADFYAENPDKQDQASLRRQQILMASFKAEMTGIKEFAANPVFNRQIAAGLLACFRSDRFDSTGLPKSARMMWLEKAQDDTQALVDELAEFEAQSIEKSSI